jgi:hypothetical protein
MADNTQLSPPGGAAGYSAGAVQPGPERPGRGVLVAVLLVAAGAALGLIGGLIWGGLAPRVVYQVYSLKPPTAYAVNPETNAFIAADGIYTFIGLAGGALLGLTGYLFGVRRYGVPPMIGIVAGAIAAAFLAAWIGNVETGGKSFNNTLSTSKAGAYLRAPIQLGSHGAEVFWPVAAALVAGGLELLSFMRARQAGGPPAGLFSSAYGRHRLPPGPPGSSGPAGYQAPPGYADSSGYPASSGYSAASGYPPPPGYSASPGYQSQPESPSGPPPPPEWSGGPAGPADPAAGRPPGYYGRPEGDPPPGPGGTAV